uniref:Uncharacterized protein n=1 Tax=Candidatus Kentrum sp. LFY TaxID=2126342 RepID=A0A450V0M4_9GAMM|nr:MAG: hypothetical protein BECKLFY1418A_GA0070994_105520 [Candidatus Kentron sp. LFY]VFJ98319.1 MAG: hypothetical protein BECKLFY1418B_GA0070995_111712 [Candidatus Kentron sp. LFY]
MSRNADVTVIDVTIQLPRIDEAREVPEVARAVRGIADRMRADHPHLGIHLTGMGILTAMVPTLALIADFLLLPPLLMKLDPFRRGWIETKNEFRIDRLRRRVPCCR